MRSTLIATLALTLGVAAGASAKPMSDMERKRAQAEHLCYNDVQKLCSAEIPDEAKIATCMKVHRAQLSPGCRRAYDAGSR